MVPLAKLLLLILAGSLAITGATAQVTQCTKAMDLTFVVDSSGSICDNKPVNTCASWEAALEFIHNIVDEMIIGPNDVRVAMIVFESSAWIKWNLTTYQNKKDLLEKIDALRYTDGNTNTIAALGNLSLIFNVQNGDRPEVNNTAILITDGKPRKGDNPYPMNDIRAAVKSVTDDWNIRLLTVGITNSIDMETLKELSSPPHKEGETVFVAKNYQSLRKVLNQLIIQSCKTAPDLPQQQKTFQCTQAMDLTFVIDSSGSICGDVPDITTCDNWDALRNFTHAIVDDMIIGPNNFMVAMIEFESSAWIRWNLTNYQNKQELLKRIDTLPYTGGTTNTLAALGSLSIVFNAQNGDRPNVTNTAIIITDGKPRNGSYEYPIEQIRAAVKNVTGQGIRLLAIGVTNDIDKKTLRELSSSPHEENESVFYSKDYLSLKTILKQVETQNCINSR